MRVSNAYPNPVSYSQGMVKVDLLTSCSTAADWGVYTVAYTKIYGETINVNGPKTVGWNLTDSKGVQVAPGLFHLRFIANGTTVDDPVMVSP
jgi:hypothetical protein